MQKETDTPLPLSSRKRGSTGRILQKDIWLKLCFLDSCFRGNDGLWNSNLFLFLSGALATLSLPPTNILPLIFLSLGFFIYQLARAETWQQAAARGWWFGMGYFVVGLYWVSFALFVDWPKFAWLLPFSVFGLPILMTVYITLMSSLLFWTASKFPNHKLATILLFPVFWTTAECLRGMAFTGFPWNLIGESLTDWTWLFQGAAIIGVYGLGFLISMVTALWLASYELNNVPFWKWVFRTKPIGILIVLAVFGFWRIHQTEPTKSLQVRIVQPNTSEEGRWDFARRVSIMNTLLKLTDHPGIILPEMVVWPEAAMPFIIAQEPNVRSAIARVLPPDAVLVTGSIRRDAKTGQLFNSMEFLNDDGQITGHYDKSHLVPFGEYMPFAKYLHIKAVAQFFGDMGHGAGPETQMVGNIHISPFICYEAIFPGAITANGSTRPQLLVNVTEDGWYGDTTGPHQHLAQARARAVEEGIPLVRAANTGISATVDRFGRIQNFLPYGIQGILDSEVALPMIDDPPPAANGGFYKYWGALITVYLLFTLWLLNRTKMKDI